MLEYKKEKARSNQDSSTSCMVQEPGGIVVWRRGGIEGGTGVIGISSRIWLSRSGSTLDV